MNVRSALLAELLQSMGPLARGWRGLPSPEVLVGAYWLRQLPDDMLSCESAMGLLVLSAIETYCFREAQLLCLLCCRLDKKVQPATEFADVEALFKAVLDEYGADHMERFVDELVKPCADVLHDIEDCKFSCANEEHQSQVGGRVLHLQDVADAIGMCSMVSRSGMTRLKASLNSLMFNLTMNTAAPCQRRA